MKKSLILACVLNAHAALKTFGDNDVMQAIQFNKNHWVSIIGFFGNKEDGTPFRELEKEFGKSVGFAQATSNTILQKYGVEFDDLPCAVLQRNFNDGGKNIQNRREGRTASVKRETIEAWDLSNLRKFLLLEGVPPIVAPDQGPDYQHRMDLVQKSPLPKIFYYQSSTSHKKNLVSAFEVDDDSEPEFFKKVIVIGLEWTGDKAAKNQLKTISGFSGKIKPPMMVYKGSALGDVSESSKIKREVRKTLGLSAPKKSKKKEEKKKEPVLTLRELIDDWKQNLFQKKEAIASEDYLAAKTFYQKETAAHVQIKKKVGSHEDLLDKSEDELRAELESDIAERKAVTKQLLGMVDEL